jgi:multiple sugar transport system ATP-binding protein
MSNIKINKLTKKFDKLVALDEISLEIKNGEFFVLYGPSGAGKTTLLEIIAGIKKATSGEVLLDGIDTEKLIFEQRSVAFAFENYALFPHMTTYENIEYALKSPLGRNISNSADDEIKKITDLLKISNQINQYPKELSGGQKQRVSLAQALALDSKIYLLDEPLSHVDAKIRHEMRRRFKNIGGNELSTTVYVTHDYKEAISLGDRIAIINDGELLQCDCPEKIWNKPKTIGVAKLLGDPKINILKGKIIENNLIKIQNTENSFYLPDKIKPKVQKNQEMFLCVRPTESVVGEEAESMAISIDVNIEISELLGADILYTCSLEGIELKIITSSENRKVPGEKIKVGWDAKDIHWFDKNTGENILN